LRPFRCQLRPTRFTFSRCQPSCLSLLQIIRLPQRGTDEPAKGCRKSMTVRHRQWSVGSVVFDGAGQPRGTPFAEKR
jgi:hypothetical protein